MEAEIHLTDNSFRYNLRRGSTKELGRMHVRALFDTNANLQPVEAYKVRPGELYTLRIRQKTPCQGDLWGIGMVKNAYPEDSEIEEGFKPTLFLIKGETCSKAWQFGETLFWEGGADAVKIALNQESYNPDRSNVVWLEIRAISCQGKEFLRYIPFFLMPDYLGPLAAESQVPRCLDQLKEGKTSPPNKTSSSGSSENSSSAEEEEEGEGKGCNDDEGYSSSDENQGTAMATPTRTTSPNVPEVRQPEAAADVEDENARHAWSAAQEQVDNETEMEKKFRFIFADAAAGPEAKKPKNFWLDRFAMEIKN